MRVIKQGVDPESIPIQAECMHCKTVVEFKKPEARQSLDRNQLLLIVKCPVCNRDIVKEM